MGGHEQRFDLGNYPWNNDNSNRERRPVDQKGPNALGLYDMTGNVWEWVGDWYDSIYCKENARSNPGGSGRSGDRIFRGDS